MLVLWGLARLLMPRSFGHIVYAFVTANLALVASVISLAFVDDPSRTTLIGVATCMMLIWMAAVVIFAVRFGRERAKR